MSTTEELAHSISEARFSELPTEVIEVAKTVILDGIGVTLAGSVEPQCVGVLVPGGMWFAY